MTDIVTNPPNPDMEETEKEEIIEFVIIIIGDVVYTEHMNN